MKKTKLTSQQKKERALIVLLSVIALALVVFCVKAYKTDNVVVQPATVVTQVVQQTTTVAPPQTTTAAQTTTEATTAPVQQTTAPVAVVDETDEILKVVFDSVNLLKSEEANFTGHKVQSINLHLVDSSVPAVNDIVNGVIKTFIREKTLDYDFTNGVSPNPEGDDTVKSNNLFPPGYKPFELTREGVASATKTMDGENTVYTIVVVAETSTLENPRPPHHNAAADTLDLSSVEIPIITFTRVDFDYPGATVSVTLNPEGEIVGYYEKLPMSGTGEGYGLGITGYGTIEGYLEENWDIQWK